MVKSLSTNTSSFGPLDWPPTTQEETPLDPMSSQNSLQQTWRIWEDSPHFQQNRKTLCFRDQVVFLAFFGFSNLFGVLLVRPVAPSCWISLSSTQVPSFPHLEEESADGVPPLPGRNLPWMQIPLHGSFLKIICICHASCLLISSEFAQNPWLRSMGLVSIFAYMNGWFLWVQMVVYKFISCKYPSPMGIRHGK